MATSSTYFSECSHINTLTFLTLSNTAFSQCLHICIVPNPTTIGLHVDRLVLGRMSSEV